MKKITQQEFDSLKFAGRGASLDLRSRLEKLTKGQGYLIKEGSAKYLSTIATRLNHLAGKKIFTYRTLAKGRGYAILRIA